MIHKIERIRERKSATGLLIYYVFFYFRVYTPALQLEWGNCEHYFAEKFSNFENKSLNMRSR